MWRGHRFPLGPMKEDSGAAFCSSPAPALGLLHRLRPTARHGCSTGGGRSLYGCIIPSGWPVEEEIPALFIVGWTPRGLATASATAVLGPRPDSSSSWRKAPSSSDQCLQHQEEESIVPSSASLGHSRSFTHTHTQSTSPAAPGVWGVTQEPLFCTLCVWNWGP